MLTTAGYPFLSSYFFAEPGALCKATRAHLASSLCVELRQRLRLSQLSALGRYEVRSAPNSGTCFSFFFLFLEPRVFHISLFHTVSRLVYLQGHRYSHNVSLNTCIRRDARYGAWIAVKKIKLDAYIFPLERNECMFAENTCGYYWKNKIEGTHVVVKLGAHFFLWSRQKANCVRLDCATALKCNRFSYWEIINYTIKLVYRNLEMQQFFYVVVPPHGSFTFPSMQRHCQR